MNAPRNRRYGDVTLVNYKERLYATLCMIIGAATYGYAIGALIAVIMNMHAAEEARRSSLKNLNALMAEVKVRNAACNLASHI